MLDHCSNNCAQRYNEQFTLVSYLDVLATRFAFVNCTMLAMSLSTHADLEEKDEISHCSISVFHIGYADFGFCFNIRIFCLLRCKVGGMGCRKLDSFNGLCISTSGC